MRDRQPNLRRVLAGQRDDLRKLLRAELTRRAAALLVREHLDHQCLELLLGRFAALLSFGKPRALPVPAVPPPQDPLGGNPQRRRLLDRRPAARRPQHDLDTLRESPLHGALPVQPLKDSTLPRQQFERRSLSSHSPTLILSISQRYSLPLPPATTSTALA